MSGSRPLRACATSTLLLGGSCRWGGDLMVLRIQSRGTERVGRLFGPIMLAYFAVLAGLGLLYVVQMPMIVLETINPLNALIFFQTDGFRAFVAMGSVVLAVTGAEALYADMGHFGRKPIGMSWLAAVMPALMLNYMGQGALVLLPSSDVVTVIRDPFFLMIPETIRIPVVLLALAATIIASQAVITGAFSLTQQAIQLGFIPRMQIKHTSETAAGQIYIPVVNWGLMVMVLVLVLFFQSSSNLAAAYGSAVTARCSSTRSCSPPSSSRCGVGRYGGVPLIEVFSRRHHLSWRQSDKVPHGGGCRWPRAVISPCSPLGAPARPDAREHGGRLDPSKSSPRAQRTARARAGNAISVIFRGGRAVGAAPQHKHNKVLHERVIVMTVLIEGALRRGSTGSSCAISARASIA